KSGLVLSAASALSRRALRLTPFSTRRRGDNAEDAEETTFSKSFCPKPRTRGSVQARLVSVSKLVETPEDRHHRRSRHCGSDLHARTRRPVCPGVWLVSRWRGHPDLARQQTVGTDDSARSSGRTARRRL